MTPIDPRTAGASPAGSLIEPTAAAVPGLVLRPVRRPEDHAHLADVNNADRLAAGSRFVLTPQSFESFLDHLVNCDPADDLRLAEI
ncbi:MAG: hypothetical protein MUC54_08770, partial [Chloroflexi bacterium]|nr:hypothetical protein [Chloroflexota bacterium]